MKVLFASSGVLFLYASRSGSYLIFKIALSRAERLLKSIVSGQWEQKERKLISGSRYFPFRIFFFDHLLEPNDAGIGHSFISCLDEDHNLLNLVVDMIANWVFKFLFN